MLKASGITPTHARGRFGFSTISQSVTKVEEAIGDAIKIKEAIHDISFIQDHSILMEFGLVDKESSGSSEDKSEVVSCDEDTKEDCDEDFFMNARQTLPREICNLSEDYIRDTLKKSGYN